MGEDGGDFSFFFFRIFLTMIFLFLLLNLACSLCTCFPYMFFMLVKMYGKKNKMGEK